MIMGHGRGAWPNAGTGGTKAYKSSTKPGPYYYLGTGNLRPTDSVDNLAVREAVKAYQRALNRRLGTDIEVTGHYNAATQVAVTQFQQKNSSLLTVWGGIGPDTSFLLLYPDLVKVVRQKASSALTPVVVSGIIRHESSWDAGAVGYVDNTDLGLAQINGPSHPNLSAKDRLHPQTAFDFVISYMNSALGQLNGNLKDAIASYNLGIGGAKRWISQGRPQWYTPQGASEPRDVWAYISAVLVG
jgi:transglycosylase-like protein with SLT domain/putative peptidoglycan binding protein